MPLFEALHIHRPTLNRIVFYDLPCPFAELNSTLVVNLEAHRNNHLQAIVLCGIALAVIGSY